MPRVKLDDDTDVIENENDGGNYFSNQNSPLEFINSGCAVLNCVLGGGWPLTRIANIVGDQSTGKTLLAIEGLANFHRQFPKGKMFYRESEAAFDENYAAALGMPVDHVDFIDPDRFVTVEDFYEDLQECIDLCRRRDLPGVYIVDSLDALSDKAEQGRKFDEGSYETQKAKQMGKLFRLCARDVGQVRMCLIIISQTRDNISTTFAAPKKTRSGGRALDFYSSQNLWLSHRGDEKREVNKVKRVVGIHIRAQMKKSKIALPYRECDFTISFGHGIDSLASSLDWLKEINRLDEVIEGSRQTFENKLKKLPDADYWEESIRIDREVTRIWKEVEGTFMDSVRQKYR